MGEIKSTLEIIMEKTKGFTMTEEEKDAFHEKEIQGKVRGLFVKFMDNMLGLEALTKEIDAFDQRYRERAKRVLIMECLEHLDPEGDCARILEVLGQVAKVDTAAVDKGLKECQERLVHEKRDRVKTMAKDLEEHGISGTAVIPNAAADASWARYLMDTKEACRRSLKSLLLSE